MSLIRSPPKSASGKGNSSSYPDLSNANTLEIDTKKFTARKRKTPENDFAHEFSEFKKEILEILIQNNKGQMENINTIGQNITSIKEQLNDIKTTTETLITENAQFKSQIASLNDTVKTQKEIITSLQNDIKQLKCETQINETKTVLRNGFDEAIIEFQERTERSKNIILTGIPEAPSKSVADRLDHDMSKANNVIKTIYADCPEPKKIFRIGKYIENKSRPIKVCFDFQDPVKRILRNKHNFKINGTRVYSDQTPYQQNFMANLKKELQQRQDNGEENLRIKYIKGIPKIIKAQPKN